MSNLDEKLKEILSKHAEYVFDKTEGFGSTHTLDESNSIAQIKQVFKDEGYVQKATPENVSYPFSVMLSGQEWYERFVKELNMPPLEETTSNTIELLYHPEVMEAAKRAGGIDEL